MLFDCVWEHATLTFLLLRHFLQREREKKTCCHREIERQKESRSPIPPPTRSRGICSKASKIERYETSPDRLRWFLEHDRAYTRSIWHTKASTSPDTTKRIGVGLATAWYGFGYMKGGMRGKKTGVLRRVEKVMFDGTKITFYHLDKRSNWVCDSYWFAGMYNDFSFVSLVWEGLLVCF